MIAHFVFEILTRCTVGGAQMPVVAHIVQDFLWVNLKFGQVVEIPMYPASLIPLFEVGRWVIRISAIFVKPHHDAAHIIDNRVGANRG